MAVPNYLNSMRIYTDSSMTKDGEPIEVSRTWKERLFSLPWRPWRGTKTIVPQVPADYVYLIGRVLYMHPTTQLELQRALKGEKK